MLLQKEKIKQSSEKNKNIFFQRFFLGGARNHIRKTTVNDSWLNLGIMEKNCAGLIQNKKLFENMNIVSGVSYSLEYGFINKYMKNEVYNHITKAVNSLNKLPAREIIFYSDGCLYGIEIAKKMGLSLDFTPISIVEWLAKEVEKLSKNIHPLNKKVALYLPYYLSRNDRLCALIYKLLDNIGVELVELQYDQNNNQPTSTFGYFGLLTGNIFNDSEITENYIDEIIVDSCKANADYLVTFCPFQYAALATAATTNNIIPIQIEDLITLALYKEHSEGGLRIL